MKPLPFISVHPGACIVAAQRGRVTCLLGDGLTPTHLLTAGHIFAAPSRPGAALFGGTSADDLGAMVGVLVHSFLEPPPASPGFRIDAALVELTTRGKDLALLARAAGHGSPRGLLISTAQPASWRARILHPTARSTSTVVVAASTRGTTLIPGGPSRYGFFEARDVIRTPLMTRPEDAGALLLEVSAEAPACLGLCIGSGRTPYGESSLFEPLDRLIARVNAHRRRPLTLWPPVEWSHGPVDIAPVSTCPRERSLRSPGDVHHSGHPAFAAHRDPESGPERVPRGDGLVLANPSYRRGSCLGRLGRHELCNR